MEPNNLENKPLPKKRGRKVGSKNKVKNENNITENIEDKPIPKKRGRKPKQNIIKNDNPVFDNKEKEENLIIRIKKDQKQFTNVESFDEKDFLEDNVENDSCCDVCWNCCHKFNNNIHGLPIKYINNIFYIYGYFCSLECASRYTFDNFNNHLEIYTLINFYYNISNNTNGQKVNIAPERLILKMFGGNMDITDYRKNFKTNTIFNINIPLIFPINHNINSYENNTNNNIKKDLKLYRKSNLPNQENSITNSMLLNVI